MIALSEATFARRVLRAERPALICFGARSCPARRLLAPALDRIAARHQGRLLVGMLITDRAPLLAEQYGVVASPTLMAFQGGERQGQAVGFLADGLLELFAEEAADGALPADSLWSPVEERFEDLVLIPLIESWGLTLQRQAPCPLAGRAGKQRGRIDLLVYTRQGGPPLTLIESKRQIRGDQELRQARDQAAAYALSLGLPSFIVAAPRGLWIYRCRDEGPRCVRHLTSLELHQAPALPHQIILQIQAAP